MVSFTNPKKNMGLQKKNKIFSENMIFSPKGIPAPGCKN
jgi:hypothetical protein